MTRLISAKSFFQTLCALGALTFLWPASAVRAAEARLLGEFGVWQTWEMEQDGGKVCYMLAKPTKHAGAYKARDAIYAVITHRPGEGTKNVFSYKAGYDYQPKSEASLKIGDKSFGLFTQGDTAWAPDANTDNAIAEAVRKGSSMVVKGTSARGTATTDTFSLKGSGAAHDAISKACGV